MAVVPSSGKAVNSSIAFCIYVAGLEAKNDFNMPVDRKKCSGF
jgi:hypothetical protein